MSQTDLTGKTAIVTGASQGIGAAIASACAAEGMNVVVHYRSSEDSANEVANRIAGRRGRAIALSGSLDVEDSVDRLFADTVKAFGSVDVLINNAGSFPNCSLLEMSLEDWQRMFSDNMESTFLCTRAAGRTMRDSGGAIINIASTSALNPGQDHAHYNSAKAAVVMFTQSAAQELGPLNIRVNAVAPGLVYRPGLEEQWPDGYARYCNAAPLGSVVHPEDIANACVFLASDKAVRITGVTLPVDAGVLTAMAY